jgi:hypothetical protein
MPITISINSGKDFEPVSEGVHSAVLADVVDKGMVQTAFGEKHKVMFVFLTDEADEDGKTKYVFSSYTASLHEKAGLRKAVKAIRGRDIEGDTFDIETLIGSQVQLVIQHNEATNGKVYANIQAILKSKSGVKVAIPADFTRKKDKPADGNSKPVARPTGGGRASAAAVLAPTNNHGVAVTDEDIPF